MTIKRKSTFPYFSVRFYKPTVLLKVQCIQSVRRFLNHIRHNIFSIWFDATCQWCKISLLYIVHIICIVIRFFTAFDILCISYGLHCFSVVQTCSIILSLLYIKLKYRIHLKIGTSTTVMVTSIINYRLSNTIPT